MLKYLIVDIKTMLRLPFTLIFGLFFPLFMLFILMTSFGNFTTGDGYKFIDTMFFISLGLGLLPTTLQTFPSYIAGNIEKNYMKRLKFWNIKYSTIIISDIIIHFILVSISLAINVLVSFFVYDLTLPNFAHFMTFILQYIYNLITLLCLGAILGLLIKKVNVVYIVGLILTFTAYFFTGSFGNFNTLPEWAQKVGNILPLKHFMHEMRNVFHNEVYFIKDFMTYNTILFASVLFVLIVMVGYTYYKRNYFKRRGSNDVKKKCHKFNDIFSL